jgi:hypothetical protein
VEIGQGGQGDVYLGNYHGSLVAVKVFNKEDRDGAGSEAAAYERLVEKSYHELMAGSRRRLWEE